MVTHQLQVERRTGKVRRPETDVLPLCHATNHNNSRAFQFGQKKFRFETNRACNICIKGASSSRCGLNGLLEKSSPDAKQDMNSMCTSTKGNSLERFMLSDLVQICGILSLPNTRTRRQYKRVHTRTQTLCPLLSVYTRL